MTPIRIIPILFVFLIQSCLYEPPRTVYAFNIINKTKTILLIESRQKKDSVLILDTLKQNQEIVKFTLTNGYYKNYNDTLIRTFFLNFKIIPVNGSVNIDPFNRKNWSDSITLSGNKKAGEVLYKLIINENDIR
jgi:hypothetical protein